MRRAAEETQQDPVKVSEDITESTPTYVHPFNIPHYSNFPNVLYKGDFFTVFWVIMT